MTKEELYEQMSQILVPSIYLKDFSIDHMQELNNEWLIELSEKADRVPKELIGKDVVLDGFCNPVDVLTHCFTPKKIFLRFHRRRWKERGSTIHYSNQYPTHIEGARITPGLGSFLKETP